MIGAVLRQGAALQNGASAFTGGYHAALAVTMSLLGIGAVVSYAALRRLPRRPAALVPENAPVSEHGPTAELGPAAGHASDPMPVLIGSDTPSP